MRSDAARAPGWASSASSHCSAACPPCLPLWDWARRFACCLWVESIGGRSLGALRRVVLGAVPDRCNTSRGLLKQEQPVAPAQLVWCSHTPTQVAPIRVCQVVAWCSPQDGSDVLLWHAE